MAFRFDLLMRLLVSSYDCPIWSLEIVGYCLFVVDQLQANLQLKTLPFFLILCSHRLSDRVEAEYHSVPLNTRLGWSVKIIIIDH